MQEEKYAEKLIELFEMHQATSPDELKRAGQLRCRVFREKEGRDLGRVEDGVESDKYDSASLHFLLRHIPSGTDVGYFRMLFPVPQEQAPYYNNFQVVDICPRDKFINGFNPDKINPRNTVEISRLCIDYGLLVNSQQSVGSACDGIVVKHGEVDRRNKERRTDGGEGMGEDKKNRRNINRRNLIGGDLLILMTVAACKKLEMEWAIAGLELSLVRRLNNMGIDCETISNPFECYDREAVSVRFNVEQANRGILPKLAPALTYLKEQEFPDLLHPFEGQYISRPPELLVPRGLPTLQTAPHAG